MAADLATHLTYTQMFTYNTYYATKLGGALWTLALEMQLYALFRSLHARLSGLHLLRWRR